MESPDAYDHAAFSAVAMVGLPHLLAPVWSGLLRRRCPKTGQTETRLERWSWDGWDERGLIRVDFAGLQAQGSSSFSDSIGRAMGVILRKTAAEFRIVGIG
jgi:hypothetical protein